jgi:tripartite-type tricarboxylate transporter receptor subunit TctC
MIADIPRTPSMADAQAQGLTRRDAAGRLAACAVLLAAAGTSRAQAQAAFTRPIRVISPFAPGIGPDNTMRVLAEKISAQIGQQVVIDSRPGGNGVIAMNALKQAAADGYTLLLLSNAHLAINPHLFTSAAYKVEGVLEPVSTMYRAPFYVAVSATGPHKSLGQLIAHAKAAPGRVTYSVPYMGSPPHLGGALLEYLTGTRMIPVAYKDNQMVTSVAAGEVDFTLATLSTLSPLVKAGKLRLLVIAQQNRSSTEPDIPTAEESGGPRNWIVQSWGGLVAPKGAPADILRRISDEMRRALASPDVVDRFQAAGQLPVGSTPAQMADLIRQDDQFYASLIKRIGMKPE